MDGVTDVQRGQARVLRSDDHPAARDARERVGARDALGQRGRVHEAVHGRVVGHRHALLLAALDAREVHEEHADRRHRACLGHRGDARRERSGNAGAAAGLQRRSGGLDGEVTREALLDLVGDRAHEARRERAVDDDDREADRQRGGGGRGAQRVRHQ
jgi:hypothetical protein